MFFGEMLVNMWNCWCELICDILKQDCWSAVSSSSDVTRIRVIPKLCTYCHPSDTVWM